MKKLLLQAGLLLLAYGSTAQGLVPKPIPCTEPKVYTPGFAPGSVPVLDIQGYNCVDMYGPLTYGGPNVIEKGHTDMVAGKSIRLGPGTHIGPLPDTVLPYTPPKHYFHAYIGENDFEVVWFEPNNTPGEVGQYEKLELGIKLPHPLDSMINSYLNPPGTTEWLNPFDPGAINVEAEFLFLDEHYSLAAAEFTKKAYGFYYREFERQINSPNPTTLDSVLLNTWTEDTTSYSFRIRFAPTEVGNWAVKIKILTPVGNYEVLPIAFKCVESGNPGYVKVGTNNRFLQLGEETFVPIGVNLPHPTCWDCHNAASDGAEAWYHEPMPSLGFVHYHNEMTDLKNKGGNYFRMLLAPWSTDIEFEKLNNYNDRLNRAWEVDRILDKAKELDLRINFDMQFHYTLEAPSFYDMFYWDWESDFHNTYDPDSLVYDAVARSRPDNGFCYQTELSLNEPLEFYTNTNAIRHYKNKVRYMISRWGYSTNIGAWELFSEIDNSGTETPKTIYPNPGGGYRVATDTTQTTYKPYWQELSAVDTIQDWQIEISRFIKEDLDHDQHLVCANYTGGPGPGERSSPTWGADGVYDSTYASSYIDLMTLNMHKGYNIGRFRDLAVDNASVLYNNNNKPLILSENSTSAETFEMDICDNDAEFIRSLWCTAFSGTAGPGFHYNNKSHDIHDVWQYFGPLNDFLEGNTFATESWEPAYDKRNDERAELFAMVHSNEEEAIGVLVNNTWNYFTQGTSFCTGGPVDPGPPYNTELDVIPGVPSATQQLKINTMDAGDYLISYYDAITGASLGFSSATVYPLVFDLYFEHPTLTDEHPLIAFKAMKTGGVKSMVKPPVDSSEAYVIDFTVKPNPANQIVDIFIPSELKNSVLRILNSSGQVVYNGYIPASSMNIDVSTFGTGIYLVILEDNGQIHTKKLFVQHEKN